MEEHVDKEQKAQAWHEVMLTFDIVIASAIIAGAIVFSAMWQGRRLSDKELIREERKARGQFVDQMRDSLQGKFTLGGKEHVLRDIKITDFRFSKRQDQMMVEFQLICDGSNPVGTMILLDDGFGRFTGHWGTDDRQLQVLIK